MRIHFYFTLALLQITFNVVFAQKSRKELKGDKYYSVFYFDRAVEKYSEAKDLTLEGKRKLADAYKNVGKYQESEALCQTVATATDANADDFYNYAYLLKLNGKYDEASVWMNKFKQLKSNDLRAKNYIYQKEVFEKLLKDQDRYKLYNLESNTDGNEFSAIYYGSKILYASDKEKVSVIKRIYNWNQRPFLDIYVADIEGEKFNNSKVLDKKINNKFHEGPAAYAPGAQIVAYTQNNYTQKSQDGTVNFEIYFKAFKNNQWQKAEPFKLNSNEYSVGQPWLSNDGNTMYFASNMSGGFGGADIYKITKNGNGEWGAAVNLGDKINTEGNEMFPFVEEASNTLFFASNGHLGLGGLDVFISPMKGEAYEKPLNMGYPLNSQYDDFALVIDENFKKGYFSSNRFGGKGGDDIYSFELLKPFIFKKIIKGQVVDKAGKPVNGAIVSLAAQGKNEVKKDTVAVDGKFIFELEEVNTYSLSGTKKDYFDGSNTAVLTEKTDSVNANIILEEIPLLALQVIIKDAASQAPLEGVKVKLQNNLNDKADEFTSPTEGAVLKSLDGNKLNDRISYNIILSKDGYMSKTITYNQLLSYEGLYKVNESMEKIAVGLDLAKLIQVKPIYFDLGKFTIRKDAAIELDKIVKVMNENPKMEIELGSHTDCRGSVKSNESLSQKRAVASANYIKQKITNPERIYGKGYGESRLKNLCACEGEIKSTCSDLEHQENRRTEFIIVKVE
jgi:outer membrane protein OmpA-like peptidoglycan-associated protein